MTWDEHFTACVGAAYEKYDSDPRAHGMYDAEAFTDALRLFVERQQNPFNMTDEEFAEVFGRGPGPAEDAPSVGRLGSDGATLCDVNGCGELAICLVGCGAGHPSCRKHMQMADYVSPLPAFWPELGV